ncbi:tRNA (adenosine(37)-N6)-threonylcarbamoyltransferase complex ATPase subunit type 1 TsaE [bacterium]|nr:MAG: tRNA (adenosine(37)-N6)-threonylcarbamoyltransferase complex ATPase subunit type 1 TsaE [bacterium]
MLHRITTGTPDQTIALGERIGRSLRPGDVIAFAGGLGSGKTTMVRGVVRGALGSDPVASPTFVFWHRYREQPPLHHLDLYRIEHQAELEELGLDEAFTPDAAVLVEWPERAPSLLPPDHLAVSIEGMGDQPRTIALRATGPRSEHMLESVEAAC